MRTTGTAFRVRFHNLANIADVHQFLLAAIQYLLDLAFADAGPEDRVGLEIRFVLPWLLLLLLLLSLIPIFCFSHPGLDDRPIIIPFRPLRLQNPNAILHRITRVLQSNQFFHIDEQMVWKFTRIGAPQAAGPGDYPRHTYRGNLDAWMDERSKGNGCSLIKIQNDDNLCLARAIVLSIARYHSTDSQAKHAEYENIRKQDRSGCTAMKRKAKALMTTAGLANHQGPCGIPEMEHIQQVSAYLFLFC